MKKGHFRIVTILILSILLIFSPLQSFTAFAGEGDDENAAESGDAGKGDGEITAEESAEADDIENTLFGYGEDEAYIIVPMHAGYTALDDSVANGYIQIYNAHRNRNQAWKLHPYGDGYYSIENLETGKVITINNPNSINQSEMHHETFSGTDSQLWKPESAGDGSFFFHSKVNEDYVMDVKSGGGHATRIWAYKLNKSNAQRFRLLHCTTIEPESSWGATRSDVYGKDWDMWDGSIDNSWYYADRNASEHTIDTAAELAGLSQLVRDGVDNFLGRTIYLTRDLNLCNVEWRSIGLPGRPFMGCFNGGGHAIKGLSITSKSSCDGFFGVIDGGCITNFAIKGSVSGDFHVGGVVGSVDSGQVVDVYSEVTLSTASDDNQGGICGTLHANGLIDHCTQNARVNSGDQDPNRGGIAGYCEGNIRYCVNKSTIDCNWDYSGGIAGQCVGGRIEFCTNYGTVGGGIDTERTGGICGMVSGNGIIFGCVNSGTVSSADDDYVGGICGKREGDGKVLCCINLGNVSGDDQVGGITGDGWCAYCLNAGYVSGDDDVGSVSGNATSLDWCRGLAYTSAKLQGNGSDNGAEWVTAEEVLSGKACYDLNRRENDLDLYGYYKIYPKLFCQNIGGDMFPTFSGQKVRKDGNGYRNETYEVRTEYLASYGTVNGGGSISSGKVELTAEPAPGCVFDHYEVSRVKVGSKSMYSGSHNYPSSETKTFKEPNITLTEDIDGSYYVKAVFGVYDETPDDLKQKVKIEIECVDDTDGWNSNSVPVYLIDTAGEKHYWNLSKDEIDGDGKKSEHMFDLGTASPVALEAYPDFGGGFTFHDLGLIARMWVNNAGNAIESEKVMISSYPFMSSKYGNDYMLINFTGSGNSSVGVMKEDGTLDVKGTYTTCADAWNAAKALGKDAVIRLDSAWLTSGRMVLDSGEITLDLNGFPIIRSMKKAEKDGEVIQVESDATLNIIDTMPTRASCSAFNGGSIQGGRSTNGAGLLHIRGTLNMNGGALYNGGTTDDGGAIYVRAGTVTLNGTLIANCWASQARVADTNGGAVMMSDGAKVTMTDCVIKGCHANEMGGAFFLTGAGTVLTLSNTSICSCRASDEEGGAIYQKDGKVYIYGGQIKNCRSESHKGGAIYQGKGELYCEDVTFSNNTAKNRGGALYSAAEEETWMIRCSFAGNSAQEHGGAIYMERTGLYFEDTSVTGNASAKQGGGIYLDSPASIDVYGKVIIRENDGSGTMDNLVLNGDAKFYDEGLMPGSEIRLRSTSDSEVALSNSDENYLISDYHLDQYLKSDHNGLKLTEQKMRDTSLSASAFSGSRVVILIGCMLAAAAIAAAVILRQKKRKGENK